MQFRRWWCAVALFAMVLAWDAGSLCAAPPTGPRPTAKEIADNLESAKGGHAVDIRTEALKWFDPGVITSVLTRETYGGEVAAALEKGPMAGGNPDAVLNAAILVANIGTASTDKVLEDMLKSSDASIRYWAAKGLSENLALKGLGGVFSKKAANALNAALTTETSGLVRREIMRGLVTLGDANDLLQAFETLGGVIEHQQPDQATLDGAAMGLARFPAALADLKRAGPPVAVPPPAKIAEAVTRLASFTSQQEVAKKNAREKAGKPYLPNANPRDQEYHKAVVDVVNGAMKCLDAAEGKAGVFPASFKEEQLPEEILVLLEGVTGSTDLGAGQVQKEFPGVSVPPKISPPPK